jgi:hypothetical protein
MTLMAKSAFVAAKRAAVDGMEALARKTLEANPYPERFLEGHPCPESADGEEEAEWRALAHAARQMRPLLEALERANAGESGFEIYKEGFDLRLTQAMDDVAALCADGRLNTIRQRKSARKDRPKAKSPFTAFIDSHPHASPETIETALLDEARSGNGGWQFELSGDKLTILTMEKTKRHLKISGIPAAVSKARQKIAKK